MFRDSHSSPFIFIMYSTKYLYCESVKLRLIFLNSTCIKLHLKHLNTLPLFVFCIMIGLIFLILSILFKSTVQKYSVIRRSTIPICSEFDRVLSPIIRTRRNYICLYLKNLQIRHTFTLNFGH